MKRSDTDSFATFVAHDLSLRRAQQRIWTNASWKVEGYTAVVGANGSGKSSTLAMLAGQLAPDAGALTMNVDGETISDTSWARRVALATPWCTPPQHLTLEQALQFHGTFRTSRTGQLGWGMLLDASGLKVADNIPMNRWSSGQRQRLNLASRWAPLPMWCCSMNLQATWMRKEWHGCTVFWRTFEGHQRWWWHQRPTKRSSESRVIAGD